MIYVSPEVLVKFEARFIPEPNSGCWLWIGASIGEEKGHFRMDGREWIASRAAWHIYQGPISIGIYVLHHCDNPWCVNAIDHLYLGSQYDNMADMRRRGRGVYVGGWNKGLVMPDMSDFAKSRERDSNGRYVS